MDIGARLEFFRAGQVFGTLMREVFLEDALRAVAGPELRIAEFNFLRLLSRNAVHSVGDIARILGVSNPTASRLVDKLAQLGLVTRRPHPGDRRQAMVEVTPLGEEAVREFERHMAQRLLEATGDFEDQDLRSLRNALMGFCRTVARKDGRLRRDFCLQCGAYGAAGCAVERGGTPCLCQDANTGAGSRGDKG